jgi:flavin-dependent dehydrogenase
LNGVIHADAVLDVLIVGAGPAGAVAAAALAQRRLRVAILEKDLRAQGKPGEVLTPNTIPILSHLRLVDHIEGHGSLARPLACIDRVWSVARPIRDYFLDQPGGRAWVVDRAALEELLVGRAMLAGAHVLRGHRLQALRRRGRYWFVRALTNDGPVTLQANFLVDASGRPAAVARRLGAQRRSVFRLLALHAQSEDATSHKPSEPASLTIEAAAAGWWYAVNGPREMLTCTLFTHNAASVRRDTARSTLRAAHADSIGLPGWTETLVRSGRIVSLDASPSCLDKSVGEGWLAIADAATSYDPIASQGLANALASGVACGEAIGRYLNGERVALKEFAARAAETWCHSVGQLSPIYQAAGRRWTTPFWETNAGALARAV